MNYDEYIAELNTLTDEFNQKRKELIRKYVDENNPYKTGDKVKIEESRPFSKSKKWQVLYADQASA